MGHRHENDGIAGKASNDVRDPGPPHQTNLIPFPKSNPPPRSLDADGEPRLPSANFTPLGDAVATVVLRLRGGFPKIKVMRADTWEGDDTSPL